MSLVFFFSMIAGGGKKTISFYLQLASIIVFLVDPMFPLFIQEITTQKIHLGSCFLGRGKMDKFLVEFF